MLTFARIAILAALGAAPAMFAGANPPPPHDAAEVLQTLGIVTHLDYRRTPYDDLERVQAALRYVGIDRLRDMTPHANPKPYEALAAKGFRFNFVIRSEAAEELPATISALESFARRFKGSIVSVEGLNEIRFWPANYHGLEGFAAGVAVQRDLYALMKRSAVLGQTPVLALTLGGASAADHERLGDLSDYADLGNAHVYFDGRVPSSSWRFAIDLARRSTPRLPRSAVTETGYSSAASAPQGVPADVQAKYLLVLIAEAWRSQVPAIYLYQLVDDRRDEEDWSKSLGLYDVEWQPKPAAHAIHHLTRTLSSSSSSRITTPSFQYTVSGRSAGVQSLSLRKTDGTIDLLIWREARLWDDQARRLTPAERRRLSVSARAGHASLVDTFTGERRELRSDTGNFELVLDDRPVIVEFPPQSTKPRTLEK
jgi:hypothetical protein